MNSSTVNMTVWPSIINVSSIFANKSCNGSFSCLNGYEGHGQDRIEPKVYMRVVFILLLVTGLIGNVLTCFVILTRQDMNRSIHIYTFNLAATDLILLLVYLPFQMYQNENDMKWEHGDLMCRVQYSIISVTVLSTIGTLVAITMDRHRGVTRPFSWRQNSRAVARLALPAIWIIAIVLCIPLFVVATVLEDPRGSGNYYCTETWSESSYRIYWNVMFSVQFAAPLLVIILAHIHLLYRITKDMDSISGAHHKRMIRMIVVLSLVYTICCGPQHIVFLWAAYGNLGDYNDNVSMLITLISNSLIILQACINPVIYGTLRQDFNKSFKSLLLCTSVRNYFHQKFGIGQVVINQTEDVTVFIDEHSNRERKTVELGIRKVLEGCQFTDTPTLSKHYQTRLPSKKAHAPLRMNTDSTSSSDSGISNTITANASKKAVTLMLLPNGGTLLNSQDEITSSPLLQPITPNGQFGSLYDVLDKEDSYDFTKFRNSNIPETIL